MTILEEKDRLRAAVLAKRLRMTASEKQKKDEILAQSLFCQPVFKQCQSIYVFLSKKTEVDTTSILRRCWDEGKQVAAPHCVPGTRKMAFYWFKGPDDLIKGSFGLWEPDPNRCVLATADGTTLCLVPGLAFDRDGYRLGFGKGYYDRFLPTFPGHTVGLCYEECLLSQVPRAPWDQHVDQLIIDTQEVTV